VSAVAAGGRRIGVVALVASVLLVGCGAPDPVATAPPDLAGRVATDAVAEGFGPLADCPVGAAPSAPAGASDAPEHVEGVLLVEAGAPDAQPGCPAYDVTPPVGGPHASSPARCGFYLDVVPEAAAVASLRNGAVWVTYPPGADADDLAPLVDDVWRAGHVLVSPHPAVTDGLVLVAWERYLAVDDVADPRVDAFLDTYLHGPQTPNLGGSCREGAGAPAVTFRSLG
jgi:hypothetical protein